MYIGYLLTSGFACSLTLDNPMSSGEKMEQIECTIWLQLAIIISCRSMPIPMWLFVFYSRPCCFDVKLLTELGITGV